MKRRFFLWKSQKDRETMRIIAIIQVFFGALLVRILSTPSLLPVDADFPLINRKIDDFQTLLTLLPQGKPLTVAFLSSKLSSAFNDTTSIESIIEDSERPPFELENLIVELKEQKIDYQLFFYWLGEGVFRRQSVVQFLLDQEGKIDFECMTSDLFSISYEDLAYI